MTAGVNPEDRIAALEAALAQSQHEMQAFTATVSHDLRAPLRHIVSFAQLVQEDAGPQLSAEVQGFLGTIASSAKQLGSMLDALLELSRVGTVAMEVQPVDLQALVASVVQAATDALQAQAPQRLVEWQIAPGMPQVRADAALLRMVLTQVVDNALKFSAGRAPAVIDIAVVSQAPARASVLLQIRDNGAGFNPAIQARLCQPFVRLHSAQQFAGLGMGLALARKGLLRMAGDIALTSTGAGNGCEVGITLPV